MKVLWGREIANLDRAICAVRGITPEDLMEEASRALATWIVDHYPEKPQTSIVCGPGNNGGDGLSLARRLFMAGFCVRIFADRGRDLQAQQFDATARLIPIAPLRDYPISPAEALTVDALFGVGLRGTLQTPYAELVTAINTRPAPVLAVDTPSGVGDATGVHLAVRAQTTLALCAPKHAQLWPENVDFVGKLEVLPLASTVWDGVATAPIWLDDAWAVAQRPHSAPFAHKGSVEKIALLAGSKGMSGAAILAAGAALCSGAGLITVHTEPSHHLALATRVPEVLLSTLKRTPQASVLALGPGLGRTNDRHIARWLRLPGKHLLDADALNALARNPQWSLPQGSILTPHPLEFSRLTGKSVPAGWARLPEAQALAQQLGATVVLKGRYSVIAAADGRLWVNSSGNAALARGGSGDVLTGMMAALWARGLPAERAAALAVFEHGRAADCFTANHPSETLRVSELAAYAWSMGRTGIPRSAR